jgi:hypothetical protein
MPAGGWRRCAPAVRLVEEKRLRLVAEEALAAARRAAADAAARLAAAATPTRPAAEAERGGGGGGGGGTPASVAVAGWHRAAGGRGRGEECAPAPRGLDRRPEPCAATPPHIAAGCADFAGGGGGGGGRGGTPQRRPLAAVDTNAAGGGGGEWRAGPGLYR